MYFNLSFSNRLQLLVIIRYINLAFVRHPPNIQSFCAQAMWYKPNCPTHGTYQTWQDIAKLYCYLYGVAKTVELDTILGPVMEWLHGTFDKHKKMSLASNCICDDDLDAPTIPFGRDGSELIIFFLPSECERLPSEGE